MAASDLATLADVKTWLAGSSGIGSPDDALISRLITDVSGAITAYLGRPSLTPRLFMERLDGNDKTRLFLRHYPGLQIITLLIDTAVVPAAAPVGMPSAKGYLLESWDGLPPGRPQALDVFRTFFRKGRQNIVVDYSAGYAVQSEAASVPATPGPYSITAAGPLGPWASAGGGGGQSGRGRICGRGRRVHVRCRRCRRGRADFLRLHSGRDQQCLHRMGGGTLSLSHPRRPERADRAGPADGVLQPQGHSGFRPR